MNKVNIADLRAILHYDPHTGDVHWVSAQDKPFGRPRPDGYTQSRVDGTAIYAHRAAWALYYGEWPEGDIDHINGDKSDNRIVNLRVVSRAENQRNRPMTRDNTSGVVGVSWDAGRNRWRADIRAKGARVNIGRYRCKSAAVIARKAAETQYGYHPNHGRPA